MATWYVDSVNGSDGNGGTSRADAFATLATMIAAFQNGDSLRLARGSSWEEECDLSAMDGGTLNVYGSGSLPLIDGSSEIDLANLSQPDSGTYPNLWQVTAVLPAFGGNTYAAISKDGRLLNRVATSNAPSAQNKSDCNSNSGTCICPDPTAGGTLTWMFHSSTDPRYDGARYRVTTRMVGLQVGDNWTVRGIYARQCGHSNGALIGGPGTAFSICLASQNTEHNFWVSPGGTATDCISYDGEVSSWIVLNGTGFICYAAAPAGTETLAFTRCWHVQPDDSVDNSINGFFGHNGTGNLGTVTLTDCRVYGAANQGITFETNQLTLTGCGLYGKGEEAMVAVTAAHDGGTPTVTITNCIFVSLGTTAYSAGVVATQNGIVSISNSTLVSRNNTACVTYLSNAQITLADSTFAIVNPLGQSRLIRPRTGTPSGNTVSIDRCVGWVGGVCLGMQATGMTFTGDNNVYYQSGGGASWFYLNATTDLGFSNWQTRVAPQEAASTWADPGFDDLVNFDLNGPAVGDPTPLTSIPATPSLSDCLIHLTLLLDATEVPHMLQTNNLV